jgi:nicotinamidase/pyrazinamidase
MVKKIILSIVTLLVLFVLVLFVNYKIWDKKSSRISQGKPIIQKEEKKQALLVIDIQEGITGKSSTDDFFTKNSEKLISAVNLVIDSVAAHKIPVIYIRNEISDPLINMLNNSLAKGSPGAALDARLKVVSDYILSKDVGDAFSNPLLDSILIKNDINRLLFTGLDLGQCVKNTILAAKNRNYDICLISDAVISNPDSIKESLLEEFRKKGSEIMTSKEYFIEINRQY